MNKCNVICLNCGNVQIRTDISETLENKYIVLKRRIMCKCCDMETKHIATKSVKTLSKKLDINKDKDYEILCLIGR